MEPGRGETAPESASTNHNRSQYQFDWVNWFYWSMWWQQYYYWAWSQQQHVASAHPSPSVQSGTTQTSSDPSQQRNQNQFYQYNPFYYPGPTWPTNYQGQPPQQEGGMTLPQVNGNFFTLQIRIINGFETYMAAPWKRLVAEVIDTFLFIFLLKAYLPEADLRIPEVLLEGSDVWATIEQEENLEEIQQVLQTFVFSVLMQRIHHLILESVWIAVFSRTPGKWLMGLRLVYANSLHLTRTQPGQTIRVVPGTRVSPWRAFVRSTFKAAFSLFCPLVIFFFSLYRGQTKYDQLLKCAVVDSRMLYRPVNASRGTQRQVNHPQVMPVG